MIRPTVARIDLDALQANFRAIRALADEQHTGRPPAIIAVVKANAYGHGAGRVGPALEAAGATMLACADIEEGILLRQSGVRVPILVFGALSVSNPAGIFEHALTPTVSTPAAARALQRAAAERDVTLHCHLKIDTGMNRLGFRHDNLPRTLPEVLASPNLAFDAVYTHFATADDIESPAMEEQRTRFERACEAIEGLAGPRGAASVPKDAAQGRRLPAEARRAEPGLPAEAQRAEPGLPAEAQRAEPGLPAEAQRAEAGHATNSAAWHVQRLPAAAQRAEAGHAANSAAGHVQRLPAEAQRAEAGHAANSAAGHVQRLPAAAQRAEAGHAANSAAWHVQRHAANSAAFLRDSRVWYDYVRPGLLLYGVVPPPIGSTLDLRPVLSLTSRVVAVKGIRADEGIGYGLRQAGATPRTIAVIPAGYADGLDTRLSGRFFVLVRGRRAPIVGSVCMDMITVDVTDSPGVAPGDDVVFIGEQGDERLDVREMASAIGTIPYEILCRIGTRIERVYGH